MLELEIQYHLLSVLWFKIMCIFLFQFKEIPKLGGVDSPFYRQNLGLTSYPGFSPGLLHPSLGGSTPFAPPNHLPTFTPKVYIMNL